MGSASAKMIQQPLTRVKLRSRTGVAPQLVSGAKPFAQLLLAWYDKHKRDLPWRKERDPYRIWLSEIMLQQTRVAAVLEHYQRFLEKFPTVQRLAAAREASVLAAWSGLGYYRRARMLHAAAKVMIRELEGKVPRSSQDLQKLPGIGRYTAAAIASIAFDEPVAVVDGNVERVLRRYVGRGIMPEETWRIADTLLEPERPGDFNQALMELGAMVCLPREPQCLLCPVAGLCTSGLCTSRGELPASKAATRQIRRTIHFGLARRNGSVFLVQRSRDESLMPGMWELPEFAPRAKSDHAMLSLRHSITVTNYMVQVFELCEPDDVAGKWIPNSRLRSLPLTGLARKILLRAAVMGRAVPAR
jgi:A/G-specific adenine glycosylase